MRQQAAAAKRNDHANAQAAAGAADAAGAGPILLPRRHALLHPLWDVEAPRMPGQARAGGGAESPGLGDGERRGSLARLLALTRRPPPAPARRAR